MESRSEQPSNFPRTMIRSYLITITKQVESKVFGSVRKRVFRGYYLIRPIMVTVSIATFLVLITFLSNFTLTATVFSEEGGAEEAAAAGFANAAIFLLIAIIGGFLIFLLFKYKKRFAIKYLFGGALSLSGAFIFFFFVMILIEDIRFYSTGALVRASFFGGRTIDPFFAVLYRNLDLPLFLLSIFMGITITRIILSRRFRRSQKNKMLIILSGMMGAFLAVIMPTWTVMFMLVGLSLYDIYSVKRGPIKNIIDMTDEERRERAKESNDRKKRREIIWEGLRRQGVRCPFCGSSRLEVGRYDIFTCLNCKRESMIKGTTALIPQIIRAYNRSGDGGGGTGRKERGATSLKGDERGVWSFVPPLLSKAAPGDLWKRKGKGRGRLARKGMDADDLMTSMTYSAKDWDLGIGDLVFYSMLVGHSFQFGARYFEKMGVIAPLLMFFFSIIGITAGFIITLRLLRRNKILPGLPMSMFLGIFCFLIGATIIWVW